MSKFLKVSKNNCMPCSRIQLFLDNNVEDEKKEFIKDINPELGLSDVVENGVLYCSTIESNPEIAAHFELSGVPAIIKLNDNNEIEDIQYGFNITYLDEVMEQLG